MGFAGIARRIGGGLIVLWLVSILAFLLVHMVPGDAADVVAGEGATQEQVDVIRSQLGLDQSILKQYFDWTGNVLQGDLGRSIFDNQPVTELISSAAPVTVSLASLALILAVILGVSAGAIAATRRGSWLDGAISTLATVGVAMPSFWVAMLLVTFFAFVNPWFPATGYVPLSEGLWPWLSHIILPATALGLASAGELARQTRGAVIDVLARPYIRSARARGAGGWWLVRHHVLRNSAIPVVTILGLQAGRLLGGAIVVDPGDAGPVLAAAGDGLRPTAILLTHHHADHVGGVPSLLEHWPELPVVAEDVADAFLLRRGEDADDRW